MLEIQREPMQKIVAALWHLLPVYPFVEGYYFGAVATLFLVVLPYIKVQKMNIQISESSDGPHVEEIKAAIKRWEYLLLFDIKRSS